MRANRTDGICSSQGRTKGWMYFGDELRKDLHRGDSCSEVRTASTKLWEKIALALCRDLEVKLVALSERAREIGDQGARAISWSGLVGCGRP